MIENIIRNDCKILSAARLIINPKITHILKAQLGAVVPSCAHNIRIKSTANIPQILPHFTSCIESYPQITPYRYLFGQVGKMVKITHTPLDTSLVKGGGLSVCELCGVFSI